MLCQPCGGGGAGVDVDVDLVALVRGGDEHVLPAVVAADDWGGGVARVDHLRHWFWNGGPKINNKSKLAPGACQFYISQFVHRQAGRRWRWWSRGRPAPSCQSRSGFCKRRCSICRLCRCTDQHQSWGVGVSKLGIYQNLKREENLVE